MRTYLRLTLLVTICLGSALAVFPQTSNTTDPLVRVLQAKGILTEAEARAITVDSSPAEQRDRLAALLRDKGVISPAEFAALHATPASSPLTIATAACHTCAATDARSGNRRDRAGAFAGHRCSETRRTHPGHQIRQRRAHQALRLFQNQRHSRFFITAGQRFPLAALGPGYRSE